MSDFTKGTELAEVGWPDWFKAVLVVVLFFFAYRFFQNVGWINAIDVQNQSVALGVSLLIGFTASLSSCLAVVGSMVVAFSEKYDPKTQKFFGSVVRPNLFFHIGRFAAFFVLGGLLGAVGGTINLSGSLVSGYTVVIAVVMGWLGLNILGIAPSVSTLGLRPPKSLIKFWARAEKSEHRAAPFLLGGITFFLPCGFTQSMQILALASGNFWKGAEILSVFSLGTAPVLLFLGMFASWGKLKGFGFVRKAAGMLIFVFAVFTLQSGLALKNVKTDVVSSNETRAGNQAGEETYGTASKNFQTVEMHVTNRGFEPSVLQVRAEMPVRWVIKGDQVSGCTNKIIVPSLEISKSIGYGENIVSFTPAGKGEISFSCGMGMVRGKFIVQ